MALFTFGYEGVALDTFVARLRRARVAHVIDVREAPISRKPGFSKNALMTALGSAGIAYTHLRELGCPKPTRDRYREDGNWDAYTRAFLKYLGSQRESVAQLRRLARQSPSCLICYEADFNTCHRTYVARAARTAGGPAVVHLTATEEIPDARLRAAA